MEKKSSKKKKKKLEVETEELKKAYATKAQQHANATEASEGWMVQAQNNQIK